MNSVRKERQHNLFYYTMTNKCLILTGQMRTYDCEQIRESYVKYLSSDDKIDLYIFTWKNKGSSNDHGNWDLDQRGEAQVMYSELVQHYSQFPFFNLKHVLIEDFQEFLQSLSESMRNLYYTPFLYHSNVTTSIPAEYKYQQAARYLSSLGVSYENVMFTRPDVAFVSENPFSTLLEDNIYYQCICHRCMDHSWVGTSKTIVKLLQNVFDDYEFNCREIVKRGLCDRENNELLIYQCMKHHIQINVNEAHMVQIIYFRDLKQ